MTKNISFLTKNRTVHYIKQNTEIFCAHFQWYRVQSIIIFISLAVKNFKSVQN